MTKESRLREFMSEDDLETFEDYLLYQAIDPLTTPRDVLQQLRQIFDEAMAAKASMEKVGEYGFKPLVPGERRYAVVVREGDELLLAAWIRRSPMRDVYVLMPHLEGNSHTSYHRDGTVHNKGFDHKTTVAKKQPLTAAFKGCEHVVMYAGPSAPRRTERFALRPTTRRSLRWGRASWGHATALLR